MEVISKSRPQSISDSFPLTLLHCTSSYPTPTGECNLSAIQTLRDEFAQSSVRIGWSDHSVHAGVLHRAVYIWGAEMVKFHLDLGGEGEEYGSGHCWLPNTIGSVIKSIKTGIDADENGIKEPVPSERHCRTSSGRAGFGVACWIYRCYTT